MRRVWRGGLLPPPVLFFSVSAAYSAWMLLAGKENLWTLLNMDIESGCIIGTYGAVVGTVAAERRRHDIIVVVACLCGSGRRWRPSNFLLPAVLLHSAMPVPSTHSDLLPAGS